MVYNVYFHPLVGEDSQFEQYVFQSFTYLRFKNTCLVHATDYIFSAHNVMQSFATNEMQPNFKACLSYLAHKCRNPYIT